MVRSMLTTTYDTCKDRFKLKQVLRVQHHIGNEHTVRFRIRFCDGLQIMRAPGQLYFKDLDIIQVNWYQI